MTLLSEILRLLRTDAGAEIEYTVAGVGGVFGNVKQILSFGSEKIVLRGHSGCVAVEGEGLYFERYGAGDAVVRGKIKKVERIGRDDGA